MKDREGHVSAQIRRILNLTEIAELKECPRERRQAVGGKGEAERTSGPVRGVSPSWLETHRQGPAKSGPEEAARTRSLKD